MKMRLVEVNVKDLMIEGSLDTIIEHMEGTRYRTFHGALPREIELSSNKVGEVTVNLPEGTKRFILSNI